MRQLTKLQDEKYRRHPDMPDSRSQSRTNSRLHGPRTDSNTNMVNWSRPMRVFFWGGGGVGYEL